MVKREMCPRCRDRGQDNLVTHENGSVYCYACGYRKSRGSRFSDRRKKPKKLKLHPDGIPTEIPHRGISSKTCALARVYELPLEDAPEVESGVLCFPIWDLNNKLVMIKYRDFYAEVTLGKKKDECIWTEGSVHLGGLHLLDKKKKDLCVWEGEVDWLTALQHDPSRNHCYIPGSATIAAAVLKEYGTLYRSFNIFLGFDNDKAGNDATEIALEHMPLSRTKIINFDKYNDLSDYIADGNPMNELFIHAEDASPSALLTAQDLVDSYFDYFESIKDTDCLTTGYEAIDAMLGGGLTPSEHLVLTADTGIGKSTLCANIAYNMFAQNVKSMFISTEMQPHQMMRKFIEIHHQKKFSLNQDGSWTITKAEQREAVEFLSENLLFYDSAMSTFDDVEEQILAAIYSHDLRVLFIDVLNDLPGMTDWIEANRIMSRLNNIACGDVNDNRRPIAIVSVCHQLDQQDRSSKIVTTAKMAGGKAVRRHPTCIIGIEGNIAKHNRKLKLLKMSRMNGSDVMRGVITYDEKRRIYVDCEDDDEEQIRSSSQRTFAEGRVPIRERHNLVRI